jgi:Zn-dependent protease with chaperone function
MISYLYWILVIATSLVMCWAFARFLKWQIGVVMALAILLIGWLAYYFYYEQLFVKNYGGIMTLTVPEGQMHLSATWKEDHLWIENYDPKTNTCYFNEVSKSHLLEGQVAIENCNPVINK